jgi:hypothetical protein
MKKQLRIQNQIIGWVDRRGRMRNRTFAMFTTESRMLLDEILNGVMDAIDNNKINSADELVLRELAKEVYGFLKVKGHSSSRPLVECFPDFPLIARANSEPNEFEQLLKKISMLSNRLQYANLRESINGIVLLGNQEIALVQEKLKENTFISANTLFGGSELLWRDEIHRKCGLEEEKIDQEKKPQETYRHLFFRLTNPEEMEGCYLVLRKTKGRDILQILNQAGSHVFAEGELFASEEEANQCIFAGPISNIPLAIELDLCLREGRDLKNEKNQIMPYIKSINGQPVTFDGIELSYKVAVTLSSQQ